MAFANGYDSTEAGVCITLSAMAYVSSNNGPGIKEALVNVLADPQYATQGNWKLVWFGATPHFGNLVFVVKDMTKPARFAIVNRGTVWQHLEDVVEDMAIFHTKTWPTAQPPNPNLQIALGTYFGLQQILPLTSSVSNMSLAGVAVPITLIHFLMLQAMCVDKGDDLEVFITGHSLGGTLATVLGTWLVEQASGWDMRPKKISFKTYTFAAPTVGNQAFADYYDNLPANPQVAVQAVRVYNESDVLPHCFNQLDQLTNIGIPLTELGKIAVKALAAPFILGMDATHVSYADVDNAHPIPNPTPAPGCANPVSRIEEFFCWLGYEHSSNTYLQLLGVPVLKS
ncbi:MAG TPA: lipase family protein [Thermoanaerobaculia bacterium]|nr:lipase family protein [Thermoanaerobaculia bacterium]